MCVKLCACECVCQPARTCIFEHICRGKQEKIPKLELVLYATSTHTHTHDEATIWSLLKHYFIVYIWTRGTVATDAWISPYPPAYSTFQLSHIPYRKGAHHYYRTRLLVSQRICSYGILWPFVQLDTMYGLSTSFVFRIYSHTSA